MWYFLQTCTKQNNINNNFKIWTYDESLNEQFTAYWKDK